MTKAVNLLLLLVLFLSSCSLKRPNNTAIIDSNAKDSRATDQLLDSVISRRHLSIMPFRSAGYDFQYLNEDEWGISFLLIRVAYGDRIQVIEQDSFTRLYKIFEFKLNATDGAVIDGYIKPIISGALAFPDSSRNISDGGDVSLVYRHGDTISVRHWQDNPRLAHKDLAKIDEIIDTLLVYVEGRKLNWQE